MRRVPEQLPGRRCFGSYGIAYLCSQLGGPFKVLLGLGKGVQVSDVLPGIHQRRER
jgi:hypothetical protein